MIEDKQPKPIRMETDNQDYQINSQEEPTTPIINPPYATEVIYLEEQEKKLLISSAVINPIGLKKIFFELYDKCFTNKTGNNNQKRSYCN